MKAAITKIMVNKPPMYDKTSPNFPYYLVTVNWVIDLKAYKSKNIPLKVWTWKVWYELI